MPDVLGHDCSDGDDTSWARFDDLVDDTALFFPPASALSEPPVDLVAYTVEDVRAVLAEVERRTAGGAWAYGFVSYEAAAAFDARLRTHPPRPGLPLLSFRVTGEPQRVPVVAPSCGPGGGRSDGAPGHGGVERPWGPWRADWDEATHAAAVAAVREAIGRGDTYQVNLTTMLRTSGRGGGQDASAVLSVPPTPPAWYVDLAVGQRGRYNAYLDLGRFVIGSASPELFVELGGPDGLDATMRPMKGTARRGRTLAEDRAAVAELTSSAKERAENVMIVDLIRNDLARIAVPGSVRVPQLCRPERYETVHQLTSDVTARLRPGTGLPEVFAALFPCGSITGAPKQRTMEVITDLESGPRGIYCGAIGVVAPPGAPYRARFSVAIRTVLWDRATAEGSYGTGGGITWSSAAAAEYAELVAKTAVLDARAVDFHLIETMRCEQGGGVRRLDGHLSRLSASAAYFGFVFDEARARALVEERTAGDVDAKVRLLAYRDGRLELELSPLPEPPDRPLRLVIDEEPVDTRQPWLWHKTSRREPYDDRRARHPEADEVLLVNERGQVTEATTATVAALIDGQWVTPSADSGCLPGVERAALLASGVLIEGELTCADLQGADQIAVINALRGWRQAILLPR